MGKDRCGHTNTLVTAVTYGDKYTGKFHARGGSTCKRESKRYRNSARSILPKMWSQMPQADPDTMCRCLRQGTYFKPLAKEVWGRDVRDLCENKTMVQSLPSCI